MNFITSYIKSFKVEWLISTLLLLVAIVLFNSCHDAKSEGAFYQKFKFEPVEETPEVDSLLIQSIDSQIYKRFKADRIPGMAVMVIDKNKVVFQKEYGVRSISDRREINGETIFRIGSLSKGFAGMLSAILIDKEIIDLDDPISDYIDDFQVKAKNDDGIFRIKHILTHTSGFTEHAYSNLIDQNTDMDVIIKYLEKLQPRDSTGVAYAYQNATFALIEKVIEKATGMTYPMALDHYLFSPLQMCNSSCTYDEIWWRNNKCSGHKPIKRGNRLINLGHHYYNAPSAGGVNSDIEDMGKWLKAVMGANQEVLPESVRNIAFGEYANTSFDRKVWNKWPGVEKSSYGLGWRILNTHSGKIIYHGGLVNGFRAEIAFDTESQVGIVALFNSICSYSNDIVPEFFNFWKAYHSEDESSIL